MVLVFQAWSIAQNPIFGIFSTYSRIYQCSHLMNPLWIWILSY